MSLKRALRWVLGFAGVCLLLLALLLGALRLLLPLAPAFQEEIARWTSESLGYPVEFARIEPSWGLTGPEFRLRGVRVMSERGGGPLLLADEILLGINLWGLLPGRALTLDRMSIAGASLSLLRQGPGAFSIQGRDPARYPGGPARLLAFAPGDIRIEDIWIEYLEPAREVRENLWLERLSVKIAGGRVVLDGRLVLPEEYGEWLALGADIDLRQWTRSLAPSGVWRLHLEGRAIRLARMRELVAEAASLPINGTGDFNLFADLAGTKIEQLFGELDLANLRIIDQVVFGSLGGQFEWQSRGREHTLNAGRIRVVRGGRAWPETELNARWSVEADGRLTGLKLASDFVRLEDVAPLLAELAPRAGRPRQNSASRRDQRDTRPARREGRAYRTYASGGQRSPGGRDRRLGAAGFLPQSARPALPLLLLRGDLANLEVDWAEVGVSLPEIKADFSGLDLSWAGSGLALTGVDGQLRHRAESGSARLAVSGGGLRARWLDELAGVEELRAELSWRKSGDGWLLEGNNLRLSAQGMDWAGRFSLALPSDGGSPVLDLSGGGERLDDLPQALRLLPWRNTPGLPFGWMSNALHSGKGESWNLLVSGPLRSFPFGGGVLRLEMRLRDARMSLFPGWPDALGVAGRIVLNGPRLVIHEGEGELAGVWWRDVQVEVADLSHPVVEVSAVSEASAPRLLQGLRRTPAAGRVYGGLLQAETAGPASTRFSFRLPIPDRSAWRMRSETVLDGVDLLLNELVPPVHGMRGKITVTRDGVLSDDLRGWFLGEPVAIRLGKAPIGAQGYGSRLELNGATSADALRGLFDCCALDRLSGEFAWTGEILVPSADAGPVRPVRAWLETDLVGLASVFPHPAGKSAAAPGPTRLELIWGSAQPPRLAGHLGLGPGIVMEFADGSEGWRMARGRLHFGDTLPQLPVSAGLVVDGELDSLRPGEWTSLFARDGIALALPWEIDLKVGALYALSSELPEQRIRVRPRPDGWQVELHGPSADGRLFWPRADAQGAELLADLNWLRLRQRDSQAPPPIDPRSLPAGKLLMDDLEIGAMRLGAVRARYGKTAGGLGLNWFRTESPAFSSEGSAAWLVADAAGMQHLGRLDLVMESSDVAASLEQLGYARGISGDRGSMSLSASWEGPPSGDFLARANGTVSVEVESGDVPALDPGGGRMLGVLSVARLPRRLALDFREMTEEGLPFDRLAGDFSLRAGQAYTCNMGLQGAVAGLALFGRAGLKDRSYDQVAVVSPNLPDLLSLGGVIVGGTGLGATMLLLSQAFREPLQAISANYYRVGGSWDNPDIKRVLREEIDFEAFGDCARYLEENLTDMPDIDWDALLSQAEETEAAAASGESAAEASASELPTAAGGAPPAVTSP